jgi:hypothetical protein
MTEKELLAWEEGFQDCISRLTSHKERVRLYGILKNLLDKRYAQFSVPETHCNGQCGKNPHCPDTCCVHQRILKGLLPLEE